MTQVTAAEPAAPSAPASGLAAPSAAGRPHGDPFARRTALYCTPHIKIAGALAVWPELVTFDPDPTHPHVREFGVDQYEVHLEVRDILDCGAMAMPVQDSTAADEDEVAFFLQLHVRTLDGHRFCVEDIENAWCVVFRLQRRDELYEVARLILDQVHGGAREAAQAGARQSSTNVPFPCLACLDEFEVVQQNRPRKQREEQPAPPLRDLGAFLSGPRWGLPELKSSVAGPQPERRPPKAPEAPPEPEQPAPRPPAVEKVVLRPGNATQTLLTESLAECLLDYLPIALRLPGAVEWVLRYSPKAHGVSMATLFRNLADHTSTVLLVQDAEEHVFGGFAPEPWEPCASRFYGSGEAFVFAFGRPGEEPELRAYPWTSRNSCFMYSDLDLLGMGGGEGRHAVAVRSDLLHGCSSPTLTFGNPTLAASEEFVVRDLEIWALEEME